ncbi:ATP-binding protein [Rubrivirga sp. IMCC43871]|uniref:ATP-binding protein n=1 Tax=Rubrivirga sp. IMCC43871 TaxID=3391575 RepID=UPI003990142F
MGKQSALFGELRRRRVIRSTLIYAGVAWLLVQVAAVAAPALDGPDWTVRVAILLAVAGLPVAVVLSWIFDIDPERLRLAVTPEDSGVDRPPVADAISVPPPTLPGALIGRESDVDHIVGRLRSDARMVTLTGPGGTGKTRLATAVAEALRTTFSGGVAFVQLAAVTDPSMVLPTIARALDVPEAEGRSVLDGLGALVGTRHVLFVLDNLEQVLGAAPDIAALLARCPHLHILATSRSPLRIGAEADYPVAPLDLPKLGVAVAPDDLSRYPATALFMERAINACPGFAPTPDQADAVVAICRRLDGLPLALELAAARVRVLDPQTLLQRLEHALDVLTTGARDLPERQRTLRATIDWSHSLLTEPEQQLYRRLAVFEGGWTQSAAEAVCYDGTAKTGLDEMASLIEQGLVRPTGVPGRFDMLQTIREFALERLGESGDAEALRVRHADHYLAVADEVRQGAMGSNQLESMARADAEAANHQAALAHYRTRAEGGDGEAAENGLLLCGAFVLYWHIRGLHISAREWSDAFFELPSSPRTSLGRARALATAGLASMTLGDFDRAIAESLKGADIAREVGSAYDEALSFFMAGATAMSSGDLETARRHLERSLDLQQAGELDWPWGKAIAQTFLGIVNAATGDAETARVALENALAIQTRIGDYEGAGAAYGGLGLLADVAGDHQAAIAHYADALRAFATVRDRPEEARILDSLAWSSLALDRTDDARGYFFQSFQAYDEVASVRGKGLALFGLAATEAAEGHSERAIALEAAAEVFSEQEGIVTVYPSGSSAPEYLDRAREGGAPDVRERLAEEGRRWSVEEAVSYAKGLEPALA